jgi:hypothetical protein
VSTAGDKFNVTDWQCIYSSDSKQQKNTWDCGLFCSAYAYAIVNAKSFDKLPFGSSQDGRDWMKKLLLENPTPIRKTGKRISIPDAQEQEIVSDMQHVEIRSSSIKVKKLNKIVREQIESLNKDWTMCQAFPCIQDEYHTEQQIMCTICRKWYHNHCEQVLNVESFPGFEVQNCTDCAYERGNGGLMLIQTKHV